MIRCHLICFAALAFAALLVAVGCGSSVPVHPVQGKVIYKGNMRQLAGTLIRLQSAADAKLSPVGSIEDDGSFAIGTIIDGKDHPGVPAGEYKGRLEPPVDDDGNPRRNLFHKKYFDFDKSGLSFAVPVSGEVVIELQR